MSPLRHRIKLRQKLTEKRGKPPHYEGGTELKTRSRQTKSSAMNMIAERSWTHEREQGTNERNGTKLQKIGRQASKSLHQSRGNEQNRNSGRENTVNKLQIHASQRFNRPIRKAVINKGKVAAENILGRCPVSGNQG